jgi:hypothetical protein
MIITSFFRTVIYVNWLRECAQISGRYVVNRTVWSPHVFGRDENIHLEGRKKDPSKKPAEVGGKARLIWENLTSRMNISHLPLVLNFKPNKRLAEADGNVSLPSTSVGVLPLIWLPHVEEAAALPTHHDTYP